ncbi:hypothetical protein AB3M83_03960 [Microbacterium sp. 179-B 1A2 NHS]|uniref:hypothetical protein n=1 Tax=Microbacterium sp. 179-B 1A2 NHS TaxID=3142383 RepID=UPI0039A19437
MNEHETSSAPGEGHETAAAQGGGALDGDDFTAQMNENEAEADEASGATHGGRVADE